MQQTDTKKKSGVAFLILVSVFFLPSVLAAWLLSLSFRTHVGGINVVSPTRWMLSILLPIAFAFRGLSRQSLSFSGALAALYVGFILTISNYCFCSSLLMFFITSSKLTKFRWNKKAKQEEDHIVGGSRTWTQVLCNGGVPSALAMLYLLDNGCGEVNINLSTSETYISSWLSVAVVGSIACACGDTWASEIGSVIGDGFSTLITTGRKVPAGTNGGVTVVGTIASGLGGFNEITKKVVSAPGPNIKRISGINVLDNHMINALACFIMALLAPTIESILERIF